MAETYSMREAGRRYEELYAMSEDLGEAEIERLKTTVNRSLHHWSSIIGFVWCSYVHVVGQQLCIKIEAVSCLGESARKRWIR